MLQKLNSSIKRNGDSPIDELYLLVHPFCDFSNVEQVEQFREIWMDSISDASKREGAFAITYFAGLPSDKDEPNKFKFYYDKPSKRELEIGKHVQKSFGKNRSKFVLIRNIYPYFLKTYDKNIESRIVNPEELIISARGVYAKGCVNDGRQAAVEAYKVPDTNSSIVYEESIFREKHIAERHGFPSNIKRLCYD